MNVVPYLKHLSVIIYVFKKFQTRKRFVKVDLFSKFHFDSEEEDEDFHSDFTFHFLYF